MAKKRLSPDEKKLKDLLSENGGLTILQNDILAKMKQHPSKDDVFSLLEQTLIAVANFQDIHHNKMNMLKSKFKENEQIMKHFGPLHNAIKRCGRGIWKSEKHKTFVQNKAGIVRKNRITRKPIYETVSDAKVYLVTDHYDTPQPLVFIKSSRAIGPINEAMKNDLKPRVEVFFEEHFNKINSGIEELRRALQ